MRKLSDLNSEVYLNANDILALIYKSKCQIMESKDFTPEQKGFGVKCLNLMLKGVEHETPPKPPEVLNV